MQALLLLLSAAPAAAQHSCGPMRRFALMPHRIGHKLEAQLEAEIKGSDSQADGCNNCRHAGWSPVWAAPGDVCDIQQHMPDPTIHFHHCAEGDYAEDYKLEDHVKLCLKKAEIDWLWTHNKHGEEAEHGHCQVKEGEPHLGPEGLLVCTTVTAGTTAGAGLHRAHHGESARQTTGETNY